MNVNSILKKEGIENIRALNTLEINKIASNISEKICKAFPEHNLNKSDLFINISRLNMYIATMPNDHSAAKYFYKNSSIYFSENIDFDNIGTLAIHEALHFIQEVKNKNNKLLRMGLYNLENHSSGMALNEAAVQLMASIANNSNLDQVKYYDLEIQTESPDYYPLECALIRQMLYFTGSYALFNSTLFGNDIFKNTFIAKTNKYIFNKIEYNFDLLVHYENMLSLETNKLIAIPDTQSNFKKIFNANQKIQNLKKIISKIALETQEQILTNCFNSELNLVRDKESLEDFKTRLYNFKDILICPENYSFFNDFYCYMMNKLDEKRELIEKYGILNCLSNSKTSLILLKPSPYKYIFDIIEKLSILFKNNILINKEKNID